MRKWIVSQKSPPGEIFSSAAMQEGVQILRPPPGGFDITLHRPFLLSCRYLMDQQR